MFSKKTLTLMLLIAVVALSFQSYALASLSSKVTKAQIALGASSAVSLSNSGGTPDMVGGC